MLLKGTCSQEVLKHHPPDTIIDAQSGTGLDAFMSFSNKKGKMRRGGRRGGEKARKGKIGSVKLVRGKSIYNVIKNDIYFIN